MEKDLRYTHFHRIITERNEAISQARFWRGCTCWLGVAMAFSLAIDFIKWMGWT